jgi:phage terminase large subunit GpA-like protein
VVQAHRATAHRSGRQVYQESYRKGWAPEPRISVSEWADQHRILGGRSGHAAIHWRNDTTPYLRDIMDALGPRTTWRRVVFQAGTQLGKTECGLNWIAFIMHHTPGPILVLRPSVEEARRFSRQRLEPMISTTPAISGLVKEARSRDGGNSLLIKEFPGGVLFLTGSHSATGVKSMPIRWLFCDEVDEYPGDVDGQGEPIALAEKRTTGPTYTRRKVLIESTPTFKGASRIEREFLRSDQRRYFIPCPACGHMDFLTWSGRDWLGSSSGAHHRMEWDHDLPKTARMACGGCGARVEEARKTWMLARGEWRPTAPGDGETIGFHLSSLYSPLGWFPWSKAVSEFLEAQDKPMLLKGWINNVLGETYEVRSDAVEPEGLLARKERYSAEVPAGVGLLVASVDVQGDRLECSVKGYGAGEESWLIAFSQFHGDPGRDEVWIELDQFLRQTFAHESGRKLGIECVAVDSGGHHSEQVYRFCRARLHRRVFAVRGGTDKGKPVVGRPSTHNRYQAKLFTLCVDTAKEIIYGRLKIGAAGPGYVHLPDWIDAEYVAQLTAEKSIWKWQKNRGTAREWIKTRDRNEALDLEVYCLAALYILGPDYVRTLEERAAEAATPETSPGVDPAPAAPGPGRRGWVGGWRG